VQEIEPHVRCFAGLKVPSTGIVNYREVSAKYVELIKSQDGTVQTGTGVDRLRHANGTHVIEHPTESLRPDSPLIAPACLAIVRPILVASSILAANLF
jgi:L-2-hydroxyglutarate oxidase LhgO